MVANLRNEAIRPGGPKHEDAFPRHLGNPPKVEKTKRGEENFEDEWRELRLGPLVELTVPEV